MGTGLAGLVSGEAAALYERLVSSGGISLTEHPGIARSPAGEELIQKGFASVRQVGPPMFVPVEPARAVDNAILIAQRQIFDQYRTLLRLRDEMHVLQQRYLSSTPPGDSPDERVRLLTNRAETGALAVELCQSAEHDVASIETASVTPVPDPRSVLPLPAEAVERGVRFRTIFAPAFLEVSGAREVLRAATGAGWQCRLYPELPMKMILVDQRAALLPLGPTGAEGAVLITAPVVTAALRGYFEMLWNRGVPVGGEAAKLTAEQDQLLRLVLTGMTDRAIARHMDISERTVRRHVCALLERLGATNRITLAVAAIREGWVD
jgi:DNA-binding CsgD family transcriptional regulator